MPQAAAQGEPMTAASGVLHFTSEDFAPREKIAAWREIYGRAIAKFELEPLDDEEPVVEAKVRNLPGLALASLTTSRLRFHKTRSQIDNDDVILMIVDSGQSSGSQLGRETRLEAGDAVLWTNGEVGAGRSFGRRVLLRIPRKAIAPALADLGARVQQRIPRETEALRLLRQYLRAMEDLDLATGDVQRLTVAHIRDLVALTIGATRDGENVATRGALAARLRAVKDDIVRNLADGEVSGGAIAARHGVSTRYLRKLFESEGVTFSEYVLDQRLALAHRLLSDRHAIRDRRGSRHPSQRSKRYRRFPVARHGGLRQRAARKSRKTRMRGRRLWPGGSSAQTGAGSSW
jgi:AraC-like DNA-binding protein